MLASERFLDLVLRKALGQAVKHHKPACRRCKSWHREVTQWTVVAQNARPPRFWLPCLGQAVGHHKPACRRCKSWHREVTQWTVVAQNARPPRFWLPLLTFTRTQAARSQVQKQTQIRWRYTRRCKVAFESSRWRSLDLEKGHWTITERSYRFAWNRTVTSFCFAVNGGVQEAKADGRSFS